MSQRRTFTVPEFGPNDLLTSDKIGERAVKVEEVNPQDELSPIGSLLFDLVSTSASILEQVRLINARFEEALNTKITEADL